MIIIWGSKHREKRIGTVADHCSLCDDVTAFEVTEHYKVPHLYYIPLGGGTLKATTMTCRGCGNDLVCERWRYARVIPRAGARDMALKDLAEQTNPKAVEDLTRRAQLELLAGKERSSRGAPAAAASSDGAHLELALENLKGMEDTDGELMVRLEKWQELDEGSRLALVKETAELAERGKRVDKAINFSSLVAKTFPGNAGCATGLLVLMAFAAPIFLVPGLRTWLWGSAMVVAGLIAGMVVMSKVSNARIASWTRRKLIPRAEKHGVDLGVTIALLAQIDTKDEQIDEKIREFASNLDPVVATLFEEGVLEPDPD